MLSALTLIALLTSLSPVPGPVPGPIPKDTPPSFAVRIVGHGKPMILIPGFKGSPHTYNDIVAHFMDKYTCYVITLTKPPDYWRKRDSVFDSDSSINSAQHFLMYEDLDWLTSQMQAFLKNSTN
jgi:hypothetical protein